MYTTLMAAAIKHAHLLPSWNKIYATESDVVSIAVTNSDIYASITKIKRRVLAIAIAKVGISIST